MLHIRKTLAWAAFALTAATATAQQPAGPAAQIGELFARQAAAYPQEKIHVQTDKDLYASGERLWFRVHLVNALNHVPDTSSRYVYVELINPQDSVVSRKRIRHIEGSYEGYIDLEEKFYQGEYMLRAYTHFMRSLGDDYFFKKRIRVVDPFFAKMKTEAEFDYRENGNSFTPVFRFKDRITGETLTPGRFDFNVNDTEPYFTDTGKDGSASGGVRTKGMERKKTMLLKYDNHGWYMPVPAYEPDFEVTFYPEGGRLVAGSLMNVALKALAEDGNAEAVSGEVFDRGDNFVTSFTTLHQGMGSFQFLPEEGNSYYAVCRTGDDRSKRFDLPEPEADAVGLSVQRSRGNIAISLSRSPGRAVPDPLFLVMHTRGMLIFANQWPDPESPIVIEEAEFPSGVIQILLLDGQLNPLSERLVFCNNDDQTVVRIAPDKTIYGPRDRVVPAVSVLTPQGTPAAGYFSVSVTDDGDIPADTVTNILSTLLLTSELRGHIEEPSFYLNKDDRLSFMAADMLMMTHGWRRYDIPGVLKGRVEFPSEALELGQEISGTVTIVGGSKPVGDAGVTMMGGRYLDAAKTGADGTFVFNGFELADSTGITLSAKTSKGRTNVTTRVDPLDFPATVPFALAPYKPELDKIVADYLAKADRKYIDENGMRMIDLDQVQIYANREREERYLISGPAGIYKTFREEDLHGITSLQDIVQLIPGAFVERNDETSEEEAFLRYRPGQRPVGFYVNDWEMSYEDLSMFLLSDVQRIDVIRDENVSAALYGTKYAGGMIHIVMKTDHLNRVKPSPNVVTFYPLGYQKHAEFYAPKYDTAQKKNDNRPDLRSTIYWNPNVRTAPDGTAEFEFYSADSKATYTIVVQGVTDNGKIVYGTRKIEVK